MAVAEHTISEMLRNSGAVIAETEHRDVVLRRRDGEDLFLALRSREQGVRETVGVLAQLLRFALHDEAVRVTLTKGISEGLAWTSYLPDHDREQFLQSLAATATACYEMDSYEPLVRELADWKATAETYAIPGLAEQLMESHPGPAMALERPQRRV